MQDLNEIKLIRKRLGFTQNQLAKIAGVSQSLIAKVEIGILDPTYSKAKKLFMAIDSLSKKEKVSVFEILNKKIISVTSTQPIKSTIQKMKQYEISQMPVIDNNNVVGLISEAILLNHLIDGNDPDAKVSDVMNDSPPVVSINTDFDAVSHLLKFYPLVLVVDKGKLSGIITKADLLMKIYEK
ncbi:CBS domain-containing protein [Candidatus Woesearchaeota archaeon]|nr:CBS domain-containing protein [Candidatus Woesearchaeota archaeon]